MYFVLLQCFLYTFSSPALYIVCKTFSDHCHKLKGRRPVCLILGFTPFCELAVDMLSVAETCMGNTNLGIPPRDRIAHETRVEDLFITAGHGNEAVTDKRIFARNPSSVRTRRQTLLLAIVEASHAPVGSTFNVPSQISAISASELVYRIPEVKEHNSSQLSATEKYNYSMTKSA